MRIRLMLLVTSLAMTLVVGFVIFKSTSEEWRDHQLSYYDLAMGRASTAATKEAIANAGLEIKQDTLTAFGEETRVDRCRTCHAAIDDPNFADGQNPLKQHPKIPEHSFNEFGCTICHEGNGRGLSKYYAHGEDHFWPEPLLTGPFIEASCARCHPEPYLEEMPHIARGRELFKEYACEGCHTIQGFARGKLGPDLTEVGAHFKVDYLIESIAEPAANMPMTIMPKFHMSEQERTDLAVFLKSQRGRTLVEDPITLRITTREWKEKSPTPVEVSVEVGQAAFEKRACIACHKLGERDGKLAPELDWIGLIRDEAYIAKHIENPRAHTGGSNMPTFWTSKEERRAIAAFLATQQTIELPESPAEQYAKLCSRCHGKEGHADGVIASNLLPRPREFTNAKFFNWLPEQRAHNAIRNGVPGTAMPAFGKILDQQQAEALFAWVRENFLKAEREEWNKPRKLPEKKAVAYSEESVARGKKVFAMRCYGCHGRRGDGKGPNAPDMLPRPRELTSTSFMGHVDDMRLFESITYGIVGTGMPPWDYLPENQRWDLVNFIRSISNTAEASGDAGQGGS
ncbi:MAG: c-type cytochrome [Deltaproteobacteria bacterium]|nr:c-type cytochrome [Deltaproteobacteria bacterium]